MMMDYLHYMQSSRGPTATSDVRPRRPLSPIPFIGPPRYTSTPNASPEHSVYESLPVPSEDQLANAIAAMTRHPEILTHTPNGQLVYHGMTVPGTNIVNLLGGEGEGLEMFGAAVNEANELDQQRNDNLPSIAEESLDAYDGFEWNDPAQQLPPPLPTSRVMPATDYEQRRNKLRGMVSKQADIRKLSNKKRQKTARDNLIAKRRQNARMDEVVDDVADSVKRDVDMARASDVVDIVYNTVKSQVDRKVKMKSLAAKMRQKRIESQRRVLSAQRRKQIDNERARKMARMSEVVDHVANSAAADAKAASAVDDVYRRVQDEVAQKTRMASLLKKLQDKKQASQTRLPKLLQQRRTERQKMKKQHRVASVVDDVISKTMQQAVARSRMQPLQRYKKKQNLSPQLTNIVNKVTKQRADRDAKKKKHLKRLQ